MLHRLILKVTRFQLSPPKRLNTVVKNMGGGGIMAPMSNKVKDVYGRSAIKVCEVQFGAKILPAYSPLDIKVKQRLQWGEMQACM